MYINSEYMFMLLMYMPLKTLFVLQLEAVSRYRDVIENELANDVIDYGSEVCLT